MDFYPCQILISSESVECSEAFYCLIYSQKLIINGSEEEKKQNKWQ